jgi:hypothetical protein
MVGLTTKCRLEPYLRLSETVPGWTRGEEARELLRIGYSLSAGAVLVEIGSFFGASAILLAGSRQVRGSGLVHCIDPFDCSGDSFSVPHYRRILEEHGGGSPRVSKQISEPLVLAPGFGFIKELLTRWHGAGSRLSIFFFSMVINLGTAHGRHITVGNHS